MASNNKLIWASVFLTTISLVGCGGSSDSSSEDYPDAYLQFYNGSSNSPSTEIIVDDTLLGSSSFGDATSLYSFEAGTRELELQWEDADGQETSVIEMDVDLSDGHKTMLFMSGDFEAPDITEFKFQRSELEEAFYLYNLNLSDAQQNYDLYVSDEGATFADAHFISTLVYTVVEQGEHWDSDDDVNAFPEGEYVFYLTEPGSTDILFQSQSINFNFASDYMVVVRNTTGANDSNIVLDVILNSTNITANQDVEATSQFRIYSALSTQSSMNVSLAANSEEQVRQDVDGGEITSFVEVPFGDYQISAVIEGSELSFDNRLLTLNQGESKTLLIFEGENQELTSIEVSDSNLPQTFEHEVNIANLLSEYSDIDIYFVRDDETIETADYKMTSLDYADARSITIPNDYYSVVAVYEDALGVDTLLFRSQIEDFTQDEIVLLTVEEDAEVGEGYRIQFLRD